MTKRTCDLVAGDRVILPRGVVRTVATITATRWENHRGQTIFALHYVEVDPADLAEWSGGNTAIAASEWEIAS
jgi:hypothetical protein